MKIRLVEVELQNVFPSVYQNVLSLKLDNGLDRYLVLWNYTKHSDGSETPQSPVVTIRTARFNTNISEFSLDIFMCFVRLSQGTSVISLYRINWLVFLMEAHCVHCEVRTKTLFVI